MKKLLYLVLAISGIMIACKSDNTQQANAQVASNSRDTTINFSNAEASKLPSGWTAATSFWKIESENSNQVLKMSSNDGSDFNIAVLNSKYYQNIEIEAKIKAVQGEVDQGGGLVWRYVRFKKLLYHEG
jgi:hypothetical protein